MSAAIVVAIALLVALVASNARRGWTATFVALVGLAACALAAAWEPSLSTLTLGGATFALVPRGAQITAVSAISLLLVAVSGLSAAQTGRPSPARPRATPLEPRVAAAPALALAAVAASLAALNGSLMTPPSGSNAQFQVAGTAGPPLVIAIVVATAALLAPLVVSGSGSGQETPAAGTAGRLLRITTVAGALGIVGAAWLLGPSGPVAPDPAGAAAALLLGAGALALFMGAIPVHSVAARAAVTGPLALVGARAVWLPTVFALGVIAWEQRLFAPAVALGAAGDASLVGGVRLLILAVALVSIAGGAIVAWLHDDLRHVLAYVLISDAGLALLALSAADPAGAAAASSWLPANALARTAFTAWIAACAAAWGTSRVADLGGWARRAPVLALGLVAVALATFGLPGWGIFALRASLARAGGGSFEILALAAAWLGLLPFLRLAWIGLQRPTATVQAGRGERIARAAPGLPSSRSSTTRPELGPRRAVAGSRTRAAVERTAATLVANGALLAATAALLAGLLAVAVSLTVGGAPVAVD
ncbi:MAG: proton-conducting transporter membrane subunit [Candidatus Limnocylindrales bacterium]